MVQARVHRPLFPEFHGDGHERPDADGVRLPRHGTP